MSAFGGKADMTQYGSPLLLSLLGVKRTSCFAAQMSAFDPKRTSASALHRAVASDTLRAALKPLSVGGLRVTSIREHNETNAFPLEIDDEN
jgi:hypothetical protein